jgi:hypothetical protein
MMSGMMNVFRLVVAGHLLVPACLLAESRIVAGPDDYREKAVKLKAGETLKLTPGEYTRGLGIRGWHGEKGKPITIEGIPGKTVFVGRRGSNTIDLTDASWIVLKDLDFDGKGLEVDAIKAGGDTSRAVNHVTIEGCTIRGHGAHQNIVGISTKVPALGWVIRGNTIIEAGTGIYLGNSDGRQPFVGGLIESNIIVRPVGYCMQIKRQIERPKLEGFDGENVTMIRFNFFEKDDRKSDAGDRPNLLVGGFPDSGPGSKDRYQIHMNILSGNPREALFQGTGRIELRQNYFSDCKGTAVRVMPHHGMKPKLVDIRENGFRFVGGKVKVSGMAAGGSSRVEKNEELDSRDADKWLLKLTNPVENRNLGRALTGHL